MSDLDNIDRQLISLLRADARTSVSQLAKTIDVSRATVQNRINRLEKRGVITGYTALVSPGTNEQVSLIRALMNIELKGTSTKNIKQALMAEPSVCAIHTTNGRWDMIAELQTRSLEEFDQVLGRIRNINEVSASETSILLSSHRISSQEL
ncbi:MULTISPECIES: Lrp/AsnC family transcriptional regulator [Thalassomonas]|uniref:Lrp/AsnC family transcriptional regulator n=1 Tax=Thalassomonas actiniarum TaxID=485447 RepID=A0AAE9YSW1_9GAMM|nr:MULTISPECIES: Lrp/AsnC family transcriptional regulator [Thalassomonas]WDD99693.1 Lrp/AsnC family transcriptional regulator [Thalassomonas actiniarum]